MSVKPLSSRRFEFTSGDVFPVDPDELVPVAPGVLVVEAERVEELVLNDAVIEAAVHRQRDHLLPPVPADGRPAPARTQEGWLVPNLTGRHRSAAAAAASGPVLTPARSLSGGSLAGPGGERSGRRSSGGKFP